MSTNTVRKTVTDLTHRNGKCAFCGAPAIGKRRVEVKGLFGWRPARKRICAACYLQSAIAYAANELKKGPETGGQDVKP